MGAGVRSTPASRCSEARAAANRCAAAGSPAAVSNTASGVSTTTASSSPGMVPDRTARVPATSPASTHSPVVRVVTAAEIPAIALDRCSACRNCASSPARWASRASATPYATRSGSPCNRSTVLVARAARSGANRPSARLTARLCSTGTATPTTSSPAASAIPATGEHMATSSTEPIPTSAATAYGSSTRVSMSSTASTSPDRCWAKSARRYPVSPAGARCVRCVRCANIRARR